MGKAPAFQFYPGDFLSDENVVLMNNQAVGCYIKLLCYNWKRGSVPADMPRLAKLCGETEASMAELWPSLEPCFNSNGHGRLVNPRVEVERAKQAGTGWSAPPFIGKDLSLDHLGDFRIIRELGRGGMGIVYEAEQERLVACVEEGSHLVLFQKLPLRGEDFRPLNVLDLPQPSGKACS